VFCFGVGECCGLFGEGGDVIFEVLFGEEQYV